MHNRDIFPNISLRLLKVLFSHIKISGGRGYRTSKKGSLNSLMAGPTKRKLLDLCAEITKQREKKHCQKENYKSTTLQ